MYSLAPARRAEVARGSLKSREKIAGVLRKPLIRRRDPDARFFCSSRRLGELVPICRGLLRGEERLQLDRSPACGSQPGFHVLRP